ncbi:MAG: hypothetical protein Q4P28_02855 [Tissierellia bacterium]|nr:hypothetical protein [Tissierellia bacterium]
MKNRIGIFLLILFLFTACQNKEFVADKAKEAKIGDEINLDSISLIVKGIEEKKDFSDFPNLTKEQIEERFEINIDSEGEIQSDKKVVVVDYVVTKEKIQKAEKMDPKETNLNPLQLIIGENTYDLAFYNLADNLDDGEYFHQIMELNEKKDVKGAFIVDAPKKTEDCFLHITTGEAVNEKNRNIYFDLK